MNVSLSARTIHFPNQCACCYGNAETKLRVFSSRTKGSRIVRKETSSWNFPYCHSCLDHVNAWERAKKSGSIALVAGGLLAFLLCLLPSHIVTIPVAILVFLAGWIVQKKIRQRNQNQALLLCQPHCTCAAAAVSYLGWHGTTQKFFLPSPYFAAHFMALNHSKLLNVSPEGMQLVEEFYRQRPGSLR